MEPVRFTSTIRWWNPEKPGGMAVADIPSAHLAAIGGLRQQHVQGRIGGIPFESSVMPAGGGRLALSVTKAMRTASGTGVGDVVEVAIEVVGRG